MGITHSYVSRQHMRNAGLVKPRQPKHCKGCVHLHRGTVWWCCRLGRGAKKATGECTLKNLKRLTSQ